MRGLRWLACSLVLACGSTKQSDECVNYLACSEALHVADLEMLKASYGDTGVCWTTDRLTAESCTNVCRSSRQSLQASHPDNAACR